MLRNVNCPHCQVVVTIDEALFGSIVECPHCGDRFEVEREKPKPKPKAAAPLKAARPAGKSKGTPCPACKKVLPAKSVFCTHCGFDFKLKRRLQSSFIPEKTKAVPKAGEPPTAPATTTALAPTTWSNILLAPVDLEFTVTETLEMTLWSLFWVGLFAVLISALVFMGMGSLFLVSGVIAGVLRVWMLAKDLSILDLIKIVAALFLVSTALAYPLDWVLPNVEGVGSRVPALTFEIVIIIVFACVFLRMVSFFFGRYFAIVRRAAFGTMFSEDDRGGVVDLGYAIGVGAVSFLPLALTLIAAAVVSVGQGNEFGELEGHPRIILIGVAMLSIAWAVFYMPMATAVVALRHSVRPGLVFDWIGKAMPDYLLLSGLLLPFHIGVVALSTATGFFLGRLGEFTRFGTILSFIYAFCAGIVFSQYAMAVTCVAVGLLMRKHESALQWRRWADSR